MAMAHETTLIRPDEETDDETTGFWGGVRDLFSLGHEYNEADESTLRYERRIWDRQIESYLDSSLPDYLREFGVLDEIQLQVRDARALDLTHRSRELVAYVRGLDEDLTLQEERLAAVEKSSRKKSA